MRLVPRAADLENVDAAFNSGLDDRMKTKFFLILCVPLAVTVATFASGVEEKAGRDADEAWSKAALARDLDQTVSFYTDDAIVLPPNQPAVRGKDQIRNLWKAFLDSLTSISWNTTRVETSNSDDMAAVTGTYELTMKDGTKDHGKYCEVWQKKGSAWKVGIDMFSSDLPAPGASPSP